MSLVVLFFLAGLRLVAPYAMMLFIALSQKRIAAFALLRFHNSRPHYVFKATIFDNANILTRAENQSIY